MGNEERFRADEVEYLLLGAAHSDVVAMATIRPKLRPGDFGLAAHGRLWQAFCDLFDAGMPIESAGLAEALKRRNAFAEVSSAVRLSPMGFMRASIENVGSWCRMVGANARARAVVSSLVTCAALVGDESVGPEEFVRIVREEITGSADDGDADGECWLDEAMDKLQIQLEENAAGKPSVRAWTTGVEKLDHMTGGLRAGQMTLLAGKTGGGKTAMAMTTALSLAVLPQAPPVLFVSLEMLAEDMAARAMSFLGRVAQVAIRNGQAYEQYQLNASCLQHLSIQAQRVKRKIRLLCRGDVTVAEIKARAQRMQAREGLSIVIVDYLQLVKPPTKNNQNREREVADVSRGLKALAMELQVPVLALSQLNRSADEHDEPTLGHLRESGSMAQDASAVVFVWPGKNAARDDEDARLVVAKSRFGPIGSIDMRFKREFTRYVEVVDGVADHDDRDNVVPF